MSLWQGYTLKKKDTENLHEVPGEIKESSHVTVQCSHQGFEKSRALLSLSVIASYSKLQTVDQHISIFQQKKKVTVYKFICKMKFVVL